jgi:hypothetical protein
MNGVKTKRLVIEQTEAEQVRLMYEMYAEPHTSYGDITRYFAKNGLTINGKPILRSFISCLLRNPVYVQADLDVYEFYKAQGANVINGPGDFAGVNGCYIYREKGIGALTPLGRDELRERMIVLAPHEGLVPADLWLKCRRKLMNNQGFQGGRKVKNTWLAGKIKCGRCGYALAAIESQLANTSYLRCHKRRNDGTCPGAGTIRVADIEAFIYGEMVKKLREFATLTGKKQTRTNPKLTAARVELAEVQGEIEKLIDSLTGASDLLISYANEKIAGLDAKRQGLTRKAADLAAEEIEPKRIETLSGYLEDWDNTSFDDKRKVVDGLITRIRATSENVEIEWKI